MFSRLWRSNQIILCAISGGSLEKLTQAVTYWCAICFFFRGVPGFLGVFRAFSGVFLVFLGCSGFFGGCSWFFGCSGMFRDVPCSGVPVFLEVLHAISKCFIKQLLVLKETNRHLVSSVGRAPFCCAEGRRFEPQTGPTLRVLKYLRRMCCLSV